MQDFTYHLFITVNNSFKVIAKSSKTKFYTGKKFLALIFILKLRGVYNLFSHVYVFSFFSFWSQLTLKDYFLSSIWRGSNRVPWGWNSVLLTTWVRTRYCEAHGRMPPPPSYNLWDCTGYCMQTIIDTTKLVDTIFNYNLIIMIIMITKILAATFKI